jgi:hypothetical protein
MNLLLWCSISSEAVGTGMRLQRHWSRWWTTTDQHVFFWKQGSLCEFSAYDFIRVVSSLHKDLVLVSSLYFSYKIENYAKCPDVRLEHER